MTPCSTYRPPLRRLLVAASLAACAGGAAAQAASISGPVAGPVGPSTSEVGASPSPLSPDALARLLEQQKLANEGKAKPPLQEPQHQRLVQEIAERLAQLPPDQLAQVMQTLRLVDEKSRVAALDKLKQKEADAAQKPQLPEERVRQQLMEAQFRALEVQRKVAASMKGRIPGHSAALLDPAFYLDTYADVRTATRGIPQLALAHWLSHGIREGRQPSKVFDLRSYLARHPDLKRSFGNDYTAAMNHWMAHGAREGRDPMPWGGFPAGTVLRRPDGATYVVDTRGARRWITSAQAFDACGLDWRMAQDMRPEVLNLVPEGGSLDGGPACRAALGQGVIEGDQVSQPHPLDIMKAQPR